MAGLRVMLMVFQTVLMKEMTMASMMAELKVMERLRALMTETKMVFLMDCLLAPLKALMKEPRWDFLTD